MLNCHGIRSKKPKGRKFLSIVPQIKSACSFVYSWCFCPISDDIYLIFSQFHVSGIPTILDSTNLFYQPTLCNSSLLNIHMHTYIHSSVHTHTNIHNLVLQDEGNYKAGHRKNVKCGTFYLQKILFWDSFKILYDCTNINYLF